MVLLIDNYDSFTYNIVQYLEDLGVEIIVLKNDAVNIQDIASMQPKAIILSPGPGTPNDAGITLECISYFSDKLPILGICLGHQAIAQAFGANVIRAKKVMHGRTSLVYHGNKGVFFDLPNPIRATRYHSLIIDNTSLPDTLEKTAWTINRGSEKNIDIRSANEIMGIRHKYLALEGVQFHPESILSECGLQLFANFLSEHNLE